MAKIFLNPGHAPNGTPDPGALGCGLRECDVALAVGKRVQGYLEAVGYEVMLKQSDTLAEVTDEANAWRADQFISIHCNAFNGAARGIETLMYGCGGESEMLAYAIQNQLVTTLRQFDGEIPDRGLKVRPELWVLRATEMPAVLVEMAFIDHEKDARLLTEQEDAIARAIARGITDFYL